MPEVNYLCDINVPKVTGLNAPVNPTDAVNKDYVDANIGSGSNQLPFWLTDTSQSCIQLSSGTLPFWLSDGTSAPITLGC